MQMGTFVVGFGTPEASCETCVAGRQLCDEDNQQVPKPAKPGIWIDPETGTALDCEPYLACIQHTTVEAVLLGPEGCKEGYMVRLNYKEQKLLRALEALELASRGICSVTMTEPSLLSFLVVSAGLCVQRVQPVLLPCR